MVINSFFRVILFLVFFTFFHDVVGQVDRCSTDEMVHQELLRNPNKKLILEQLELFTQNFTNDINSARLLDTTYIIPVVVHIIHNYGDERINISQVESAIKSMNDDFNLSNNDLVDLNGDFVPSTANNIDTVSIELINIDPQSIIEWQIPHNSSVQKNDTIAIISNGLSSQFIIADDAGNTRFCGGIFKSVFQLNDQVNEGDIIGQIITTEARGFEDRVANVGIEFRLATKDPFGNCTTGITYNQSSLTYNGGENVKDDTYWDNDKYLNIWTVANVASGAAAYAYYPGSAPTNHEGILCQHDYFGTTGTSSNSNWRRHTMSHEAGHYFNLPHPWGSTNDPSLEDNCNSDDGVDDTPNTIGASGCLSYVSQISCNSLDNVANIMDYTNCAYMFTLGQKERMIAALNSTSGSRNNLWSQENLEITGTDDIHFFSNPYTDCTPIPDFRVVGDAIGALGADNGFSVSFEDMSYNVPENEISYQWFFPGANPSTSNQQNPTVTYDVSGQHNVTLIVSNDSGESELTKEKCIVVLDQTISPFLEDFESSIFPISDSMDRPSWYVLENYPMETNWTRSSQGAYEGNQSIRIRSKNFSSGLENIRQQIYSPEIDCSNSVHSNSNPFGLYFNVAYARRLPYLDQNGNSIIPDRLIVSRKHANQSFMTRATYDVEDLVVNQNTYFNEYTPAFSDWTEKFVNLGSSAGQESVIIRFEFTGRGYLSADTVIFTNNGGEYISNNVGGNWLYIDNFRIGNFDDLESRVQINEIDSCSANGLYDLFGRKYNNDINLKTGIYIKNGKLLFIKNDL